MSHKKTIINWWVSNLDHAKDYNLAAWLCGGGNICREPTLVEYVKKQHVFDGITVFADKDIIHVDNVQSKYKICWLLEPKLFEPWAYEYIKQIENKFDIILTYDRELLNRNPNLYKFISADFCDISNESIGLNREHKTKLVSFPFSNKTFLPGHKLRHVIANEFLPSIGFDKEVDLFGSGCSNPFTDKGPIFKPYMFSIAIENSKMDDYFTEKVLDPFCSGTIPIYWGFDKIGNYFNKDGILSFNTAEELKNILYNLSEDMYNSMYEAVKENYELSLKYVNADDEIFLLIKKYLAEKNIEI